MDTTANNQAGDRGGKGAHGLWPACVLVCVATFARVVYLRWFCPYSLVEDEAQYWVWSQIPDWSYATKGPGIAWAIKAGTSFTASDAEWAVRLPAVLCSAIGAWALAWFTWDWTRSRRTALISALAFQLVPAFQCVALLMTIDGPLLACWACAMLAAWKGLGRHSRSWALWTVALGGWIGAGVLFKYTMLLIVPGIVWWALRTRSQRDLLTFERPTQPRRSSGALSLTLGFCIVLLCLAPIFFWNRAHGWPTIAHLLGHLGVGPGDTLTHSPRPEELPSPAPWIYNPGWTLSYLGTTLAVIGPVLILGILEARGSLQRRSGAASDARDRAARSLLIACAAPVLVFYLVVSFFTQPEGNWAIAGAVTLVPLAASRVERALRSSCDRAAQSTRAFWTASLIVGLLTVLVSLRADLLAKIPVIGSLMPAGRFSDAQLMGEHARRLVTELHERTGQEPFVMAHHYGRASLLWYYLHRAVPHGDAGTRARPVYCSSSVIATGRITPWDFWTGISLREPRPELLGRPALVVGLSEEDWSRVFDRAERIPNDGMLAGDQKRVRVGPDEGRPSRPAFFAYGFRGFPEFSPTQPGAAKNAGQTSPAKDKEPTAPPDTE